MAINKTFANVKTMDDCMALVATGEMPTLLAMAHQPDNREKVLSLVILNIAALDEFLHLNNRLTEREITTVAEKIIDTYGGAISFADLNIVLENAKCGAYGKFYERLSSADILSWIAQWYEDRLNEAECRSIADHERSMQRIRQKEISKSDAAYQIFKDTLMANNFKLDKDGN